MIRLEHPVAPATAAVADCPGCQGNGEIAVERLFGRFAPEPYRVVACTSCGGTGMVPAEAVVVCAGCGGLCWADQVCTHTAEDALCGDCRPRGCRDCVDEAAER